jgi:hypothetical protein
MDEPGEEGAGGGADLITALRVPLNSQHKVRLRVVLILPAFYGFDHPVFGAACDDAEAISGDSYGLMVAGVDGKPQKALLLRGFSGHDLSKG